MIRKRLDDDAVIQYSDLEKGDEDYELLKAQKHARRTSVGKQYYDEAEHEKAVEKAREKAQMEARNEWITAVGENTDLSTYAIAELPNVDVSQQRVQQIISENSD